MDMVPIDHIKKDESAKTFLSNLDGYASQLSNLYSNCETNSDFCTQVDKTSLDLAIKKIEKLVKEIIKDVELAIVPESFYRHIQHDFEQVFNVSGNTKDYYWSLADQVVKTKICETYDFYKKLNFAQKNTVLVGANGCGKTTLANLLKSSLNNQDGIVIPAQKLLILPQFSNTPNLCTAQMHFDNYQRNVMSDKFTFEATAMDAFDYSHTQQYGSEMAKVIGYLLGERLVKNNRSVDQLKKGVPIEAINLGCTLDEIIKIWNSLIEHRRLECDENNLLQLHLDDSSYEAYSMSDGERVIIYHAARVLLAPKNSLVIVDEPEIHLHKSIANKLWDHLEKRRQDCIFIYFTHDLDFAISRVAQKGWIKDFNYPNHWNIELIQDDAIPEELLLKLIGSRKKILFCEGNDKNSIDRKVFEILFSDYTIQPVESCKKVIEYTRAFNKLKNVAVQAYGLIDRDFRCEEQIKKLENEFIYSYSVAEVENLFLVEKFILNYATYKHEELDMEDLKSNFFHEVNKNLENQLAAYVCNAINYTFTESHVQRGDTKEKVKENFDNFVQQINIDKLYEERKTKVGQLLSEEKYDDLIKIINNKGLISNVAKSFGYRSGKDYLDKALKFLSTNEDAQKTLMEYFPKDLIK